MCDKGSLHDELEFLKATFGENGCSIIQIRLALNPEVRTTKSRDKPTSVVLLPYVQMAQVGSAESFINVTSE